MGGETRNLGNDGHATNTGQVNGLTVVSANCRNFNRILDMVNTDIELVARTLPGATKFIIGACQTTINLENRNSQTYANLANDTVQMEEHLRNIQIEMKDFREKFKKLPDQIDDYIKTSKDSAHTPTNRMQIDNVNDSMMTDPPIPAVHLVRDNDNSTKVIDVERNTDPIIVSDVDADSSSQEEQNQKADHESKNGYTDHQQQIQVIDDSASDDDSHTPESSELSSGVAHSRSSGSVNPEDRKSQYKNTKRT